MMRIELKDWKVFDEIDFNEDGIDKIKCSMLLNFAIYSTDESIITEFTRSIECVYLNSMTGYEMDKARLDAVEMSLNAYESGDAEKIVSE